MIPIRCFCLTSFVDTLGRSLDSLGKAFISQQQQKQNLQNFKPDTPPQVTTKENFEEKTMDQVSSVGNFAYCIISEIWFWWQFLCFENHIYAVLVGRFLIFIFFRDCQKNAEKWTKGCARRSRKLARKGNFHELFAGVFGFSLTSFFVLASWQVVQCVFTIINCWFNCSRVLFFINSNTTD